MRPPLRKGEIIVNFTDNDPLLHNKEMICKQLNDLLNSEDPQHYNGALNCRFPDDHDDPVLDKGEEIFSKFGDMFDKVATVGSSSTQWISVTIIACAIAITAVVIRRWMKKEHTNTTTYSPVYTSERNPVSPVSDQRIAIAMSPFQPEVLPSQNPGVTMERFFKDVARKKPIKFSAQDIKDFIGNPSLKLGSGGYGDVYRGTLQNEVMAIKVLKGNQPNRIKEQFIAELGTLGVTHHVNLVRLYGFCFDPTIRALVYEYMENGSLDKLLFQNNQQVEWQKLRQIAIGVATGLAYLHEYCKPEIIHYDIKPGNVLLDSELNPKVADFGLARLGNKESNSVESIRRPLGTVGYAAPELSGWNITVTNKCDVYSFGVLLLEIIGRRKNYKSSESNENKQVLSDWTWRLWEKGELTSFFEEYGIKEENQQEAERMLMVVFLCVNNDPNKRPKMSNVVKMLEGEQEIIQPLYPFEKWSGDGDEPNGSTSEINEKSSATLDME